MSRPTLLSQSPPNLSENIRQVTQVNADAARVDSGYAKRAYFAIAMEYDLISDHQQYESAMGLWQAITRSNKIHVYVYDDRLKDYLRDEYDKVIRYDGKNIDEHKIGGHQSIFRK